MPLPLGLPHSQWSKKHVPKASLGRWFGGGGQKSKPNLQSQKSKPNLHPQDQVATALIHAVGNTNLSVRREEGMGRGVFTTLPVLPGATVARSALVIDARWALESAYCHSIDAGPDEDPYAVLCVFLYKFLHCSSREVRDAEPMALSHYREVLSEDTSSSVLEWTDGDVDMLLGSHLHIIANDLRSTGEATIQAANHLLGGDKDPEELRRCLSILLTRLVRLDDGTVALVPGLDLMNHSSTSRSYIVGTREGVKVVNRGFLPLAKGDQVFISYGGKTNGELFISYGFIPEQNPHDGVLVPLDGGETVVLGVDGGVRLVGSERGIDRDRVRVELKRRVRRQLEAMMVADRDLTSLQGAVSIRDDLLASERKMLSRALMSL